MFLSDFSVALPINFFPHDVPYAANALNSENYEIILFVSPGRLAVWQ